MRRLYTLHASYVLAGRLPSFLAFAHRGRSRAEMNRVYRAQTGREMSDYILVQQADKVVVELFLAQREVRK